MNEKKKDVKKKDVKKKDVKKKRRIKAHPPHHHPHPDQLRNYEAGHTYGGLKTG